jgi:hypothetical protein
MPATRCQPFENAFGSRTDPNFVEKGAIPWLLPQVVGSQPGPNGRLYSDATSYIQRVKTVGGFAPPSGCSEATNVGSTALMPYSVAYLFSKDIKQK